MAAEIMPSPFTKPTRPFSKDYGIYRFGIVLFLSLFVLMKGAAAIDYYQEDFEAGLGGYVLDNSSGLGNGLWHRTDKAIAVEPGHSAFFVFYYGLDDPCNYKLIDPVRGPMAHQGRAISPVVDLTGGAGRATIGVVRRNWIILTA